MRRGLTVVEVMIGLVILGIGLVPVLNLMGGTRGTLGQTKEMLRLEGVTFQALAHARSLIAVGEFAELTATEVEAVEFVETDLRCEVTIQRVPARPLFRLDARATLGERYFTISSLVADPLAGAAAPAVPLVPGGIP